MKDSQLPEISRFDPIAIISVYDRVKFLKLYVLVQRLFNQNIIACVYKNEL